MNNNSTPIWRFPVTFEGGGIGFNDGGTQLFKDDSIQSLAREVCQNSIDARSNPLCLPAEVEFKTFKIASENFPGRKQFTKIINDEIEHCKSFYKNNKSALEYYGEALETLNQDSITCLRISDFNTTGLTVGKNPRNSNWSNLVIHSGTNDKTPEDGGSFGLGKNAMYACSKFGALFFSTYTIEEIKRSECVAKLSYYYDKGKVVHGLGFYGNYNDVNSNEEDNPIDGLCCLDGEFSRRETEYGTDVYILGFEIFNKFDKNEIVDELTAFEESIASAIIDSYFISILQNKLIVKINTIELNKNNLFEIFDKIYSKHPRLFNDNTKDYLDIWRAEDKFIYSISIMEETIPDAELFIKLDPSYHNKVAMVRNTGMKIFDKGYLTQATIFSGILVLKSKEVNGYFKSMENPAHDEWILDRIRKDKKAKERYDRMINQINSIIKNLADENAPQSLDVAGLGEFLPDDFEIGDSDKRENINDDFVEIVEVRERKQLPIEQKNKETDEKGESVSKNDVYEEYVDYQTNYNKNFTDDFQGGLQTNQTYGGEKFKINKDSLIYNVKKRNYYNKSKKMYSLIMTLPERTENCKIEIQLSGEQTNFKPKISFAKMEKGLFMGKKLDFSENIINLGKIEKGEKIEIYFNLEEYDDYSLEVNVYED